MVRIATALSTKHTEEETQGKRDATRNLGHAFRVRSLFILLSAVILIGGCSVSGAAGRGQSGLPFTVPSPATALPGLTPGGATLTPTTGASPGLFDGYHSFELLLDQVKIGARPVGSPGDRQTGDFILAQLKQSGWQTSTQEFTYHNIPIRNIIGRTGIGRGPVVIVGAHYDARPIADQDKQNPAAPMPAANDGASGVAVLLELARTIDVSKLHNELWLAFLDGEDNGGLTTCLLETTDKQLGATQTPCDNTIWPFSVGASYLADHLASAPEAVVILDMVGDVDQNIYYEQYSNDKLKQQLWEIAARLGYSKEFIPKVKWPMEDDHTAFLKRGFVAVDIIDFDYPYWHTTQDTPDKCSPASLERVGRVVQAWLEGL